MKLLDTATATEIILPDDLLWTDELKWVPVVSAFSYSLTGALLIDSAQKLAGRPITLQAPDEEMAWVSREVVENLRAWASVIDKDYKLVLEYPTDTRQFDVQFKHDETPVEAEPVKGFPGHSPGDWFRVTIRLIEV